MSAATLALFNTEARAAYAAGRYRRAARLWAVVAFWSAS